jgi:hypothetical protein
LSAKSADPNIRGNAGPGADNSSVGPSDAFPVLTGWLDLAIHDDPAKPNVSSWKWVA